jgi:hypothetical protein|tara:strand:+ start:492 stop:680 length:189 start_codon:yes stop_codon:yes gene_type:complete
MLEGYDKEVKGLKKRLLEACWYMRGGISYGELMQMALSDLGIIEEIVTNNLETTKKSGLPFF